ncbi:MAG: protein kinase domain-containing protein [Xenococcaceae cyanobacterium]
MVIITLLDANTYQALQKWNFENSDLIRIGRSPDNNIKIEEFFQVSRYHLELHETNGQWHLISKGTNGTFLNGILTTETLIKDNDLIQLAQNGPLLKFQLAGIPNDDETQISGSIYVSKPGSCDHSGNHPNNIFCVRCGQPLVSHEQFVGCYQILRTLGRGGMGTTYLVWNQTKNERGTPLLLVLKEMNADMAQVAKARELFEREARVLKTLNHPGIPKYYDFFVENSQKYLVMELIHGQNLEQMVYLKGPFAVDRAIEMMIQVSEVLDYLHSLNPPLIHRDVKPANLMMRFLDGRLMLLDFGAVKEVGTSLDTRIGVEGYTAPEQYRGKPCPQSDLYAIGATLIFLISGKAPMQYYVYKENRYEFDLDSVPEITPQLKKVIAKACEPNVRDRFQSAQELSKALAECF